MLRLSHVTKTFGATIAVADVTLNIERGEIVGIVGENGAGKTTLMRMIAGELAPDSGTIDLDGTVSFVHQHFVLVDDFTIAENLALGDRTAAAVRTRHAIDRRAESTLSHTGIGLTDVTRRVDSLSVGEKSKLELIRAIARQPDLLILDEPTSVLTPLESSELFGVMRGLAAAGVGVAFISHKLREVLEVASRVIVMRRGRVVATARSHEISAVQLAALMVETGAVEERASQALPAGAMVVSARSVSGERLRDVTLEVRRGEIIAIAGVAGNGQGELIAMLRGVTEPRSGMLEIAASRVAYIPEDRTREGIVAEMTIAENIALGETSWSRRAAEERAAELIARYSIRAHSPRQAAGSLSGGNQQKVILARELAAKPDLIVAAEPTRGLDVESARFIHSRLRAAAADGAAIVLVTSDLDEALSLADAVHVLYRGEASERLSIAEAPSRIPLLMAGLA